MSIYTKEAHRDIFDDMLELLTFVPSFSKLRGKPNDDWIDRMSHVYTTSILIIFTVAVSSGQIFKHPIQCWVPAQFEESMERYTEYHCWIKNTFYVPMLEEIPENISERQDAEITYYQWVPLILIFMAFLFKLPNVVWRIFNGGSGMNLDQMVLFAEQTQLGSPKDREKSIKTLAHFMDKWLDSNVEKNLNFINRTLAGMYLIILFLFVKVLYVSNAFGQLYLLNAFLSTKYSFYGFDFSDNWKSNRPWRDSPRFPRVTLCDFQIRQLQNVQRFTIQCVLPINLFNEKIFIFIWFWLIFITFLAACNLLMWIYLILLNTNKIRYCKKYLKMNHEIYNKFDKVLCRKFAENYMRDDGVLVLRVISNNSSDMVVTDLVKELWSTFKNKYGQNTHTGEDTALLNPVVNANHK
ncbi:innexin unc-9-like isoform X1 [Mytilus galloprovincialis]|uniref:innexin unc-9-like isoform X1 n=2 Tax=Mytilus galloprovincialis TaxID=29158 RepID=UPI003F7C3045